MNLKKLYQQVLLDHNKNPRNFKVIDDPTHYAGVNPLCGDDYHLFVKIEDDKIKDIGFRKRVRNFKIRIINDDHSCHE